MRRVTGLGGVFFKANNPDLLYEWYEKHLGIKRESYGVMFSWRDDGDPEGGTAWSIFPKESGYFNSENVPLQPEAGLNRPPQQLMINYRVDNLDALLEALRGEGVWIDPKREDADYGRFAWIMDPEGNRIELWEPPKKK
jgi:catechol 2,3-dioxygenase-like lactoylglutathione lyase family enzyme